MYAFSWERDSDRFSDAEYLSEEATSDSDDFEDVEVDDSLELDESEWVD